MTYSSQAETSLTCVPLGARGQLWFGLSPLPASACWIVWLSTFGDDVQVLSAWGSQELARAATDRYTAAAVSGMSTLLREIESTKHAPGSHPLRPLSDEERQQLLDALPQPASARPGPVRTRPPG